MMLRHRLVPLESFGHVQNGACSAENLHRGGPESKSVESGLLRRGKSQGSDAQRRPTKLKNKNRLISCQANPCRIQTLMTQVVRTLGPSVFGWEVLGSGVGAYNAFWGSPESYLQGVSGVVFHMIVVSIIMGIPAPGFLLAVKFSRGVKILSRAPDSLKVRTSRAPAG